MTTLHLRKSSVRSPLRRALPRVQPIWIIRGFLFIPLALACFALSPSPNAFGVSPAPDGGYANFNTAEGDYGLFSLTTGSYNTATGTSALSSDTTGSFNTATGSLALTYNNGHDNTATGYSALFNNLGGSYNTATGSSALIDNTTGTDNTANGFNALYRNTAGYYNTANGDHALYSNTTGKYNAANGSYALYSNTIASYNTANGLDALYSNISGSKNTANGSYALFSNTTINGVSGINNTASGYQALYHNATGTANTAEGFNALLNNTGSTNIGLGSNAGANLTTGSNNIDIGAAGVGGESNKIRIGTAGTQTATFIAGIRGITTVNANAVPVVIDSAGQLGTVSSSKRFKKEIKPMDQTSEAILGLKPVTFHYKSDSTGTPQFGLIAEEVAKVNPDLVVRDQNGEIYTVRYEAVNAMLLNEFLKEHRKNEEQEATIARQQKQIEALAAGLQKVSAQLEVNKPAPQIVDNDK